MNKFAKTAALGCLMLALPVSAHARDVSPPLASSQDGLFVVLATQGSMTEMESSKLARDRSNNPEVRAIADRMIADHKYLSKVVAKDADNADVYQPYDLDAGHQMEISQLEDASATDFDNLFLQIMDKEHREAIMAFSEEADKGMNLGLVADAKEGLPKVEMHQRMIRDAEQKMGIKIGALPSMADKPPAVMANTDTQAKKFNRKA